MKKKYESSSEHFLKERCRKFLEFPEGTNRRELIDCVHDILNYSGWVLVGFLEDDLHHEKNKELYECGHKPRKSHSCPYQEDVEENSVIYCTCCKKCEHECAMSI